MDSSTIAKWIIFLGLGVVLFGVLFWVVGKTGIPIGKLPGDIRIHKEKFALYFPLVTSLVLSVLFTFIVNLIIWLFRR